MTSALERINNLERTWQNRATVREDDFLSRLQIENWRPEKPDYPESMLPFSQHPTYQNLSPQIKSEILTWAWIAYNQRTIAAETYVANPAFEFLLTDYFFSERPIALEKQIRESLIDEHFHSLMHVSVMDRSFKMRNPKRLIQFEKSVTHRRLLEYKSHQSESWQKEFLTLIFAIVSEVSINTYLELMSKNREIQDLHRLVTTYHNRDEYAHASLLIEITKILFEKFNDSQKKMFFEYLPKALSAFLEQDYSMWASILHAYQVSGWQKMLTECEDNQDSKLLSRDFSGLRRLAEELNIRSKLEFDFS